MRCGWIALALMLCGSSSAETNGVITSAAELTRAVSRKVTAERPFRLRATALSRPLGKKRSLFVVDESGGARLADLLGKGAPAVALGDLLQADGFVGAQMTPYYGYEAASAYVTNIVVLSHGSLPESTPITAGDIPRDDLLLRPVCISGILVDVRQDEIDPNYSLFVLDSTNQMVYAAAHTTGRTHLEAKGLIGATVRVHGVLYRHIGLRAHARRLVLAYDDHGIEVLKPPSDEIFGAPEVGEADDLPPEAVVALGRRKAVGRVLAVWNDDTILLRTASGSPMKVQFATRPPKPGDVVEAVGYAETDLFHVNLARATGRPSATKLAEEPPAADVAAGDLLGKKLGARRFNMAYHGRAVRLRGVVRDIPSDDAARRILVDSGGHLIAVDCSAAPEAARGLATGCTVAVTGVCVMETETWNQRAILPRTTGMFIAVGTRTGVEVLAQPPWWTAGRLVAVIGGLVVLIVAILIWNTSLRTLSERRGRELYRSQIAQARSELRTDERTRLAAELHDHLAQNLTAISYQVAAAERSRVVAPEASGSHLAAAARMLGSCRTELRRCIWDLRSDALDEPDFAQAIRRSIEPVAGAARVDVDADVSRSRISEQTAHAALSAVRELVANAVNHGHARNIAIRGERRGDTLSFSVADDGCGFDPVHAPGSAEGHFGLEGVAERARRNGGSMRVASSPGGGTKVTLELKA